MTISLQGLNISYKASTFRLWKFAKQHMKEGYEMSLAELERWSELTLSADFEDAEAHVLPK